MAPSIDVRFTRNSGHRLSASECPLCANSGQSVSQRQKSRDRFRVRLSETSVHLSHSVAPVSLGERNADYAFCEAFNKGALAFYAPRITGQRAIVANYTMTGNGDSEFIRGASSRHCADGLRRANAPRDVSVGHRCAGRYFPKRLPNALLEGRASDIKGKVEAQPRLLDEPNHARNQVLVVAVSANKVSLREAVLEVTDEFVRVISKKDGSNALLGRRDQDSAKTG